MKIFLCLTFLRRSGAGVCFFEDPGLGLRHRLLAGPVAPQRGAHAGAGFVSLTRFRLEQPAPEGLHPVGDPHWSSSWRTAACGKAQYWRSSWRAVCCGGAAEDCEESSPEKQGAAESVCDKLTTTPLPVPPWGGGKEFRNEAEPRKKRQ